MNLEIETLQLELPVHETKRALHIVDLVKESLARMPPLPLAARNIRIARLIAEDLRLTAYASDAEIADAVTSGIHRALVQAISSEGGGAEPQTGPASQAADTASGVSTTAGPPTDVTEDAPEDGPESRVEYQLPDPTLHPLHPASGLRVPELELISASDEAEDDLFQGKIGDMHYDRNGGRPFQGPLAETPGGSLEGHKRHQHELLEAEAPRAPQGPTKERCGR